MEAVTLSNNFEKVYVMITHICFQTGNSFGHWSKGLTLTLMNISVLITTKKAIYIILFEDKFILKNIYVLWNNTNKRTENTGVLLH